MSEPNAPPPSLQRVRVPRLTSMAAARREMARQYAAHLRGEIGNKTLHVRVYTMKAIRESFMADEIEQRLQALEERTATHA